MAIGGWIELYVLVAVAPVLALAVGPAPSEGFWHETAIGLGFIGATMTAIQFARSPDG